jgi:predicted MPP superfamily phosphohydrolase
MFIVILTAVLASMHLYVWKRLIKDTTTPGRTRRILTLVLVALGVLLVATLILPRTTSVTGWFVWPGWLWFALVAYLFLLTLVAEPIRLGWRAWTARRQAPPPPEPETATPTTTVDRRLFLSRATAATVGVASVGLVGFGAARALGPPDVLRVPVRLARLDPAFTGYRIAVVSDIHLGPLAGRAHTERIVETINATNPDLVAIVGDLVDGTVDQLGPAAEPLQDLVSRDGSFFVTGNHEYFVDDTMSWLRELERFGVAPLRNENTAVRRGRAAFDLAGVNDITGETRSDPPDFDRALAGTEASRPTILLAHQPIAVEQAAARGVDLQLSGHTHGGQMWPFHYLVGLAQPALAGLSTVDGTQLYVTRGAGFWGPPVRVGAPPDITVVALAPREP